MRMIGLQQSKTGNSIQTAEILTEIHFTMYRTQATMAWPTHKDTKNNNAASYCTDTGTDHAEHIMNFTLKE